MINFWTKSGFRLARFVLEEQIINYKQYLSLITVENLGSSLEFQKRQSKADNQNDVGFQLNFTKMKADHA